MFTDRILPYLLRNSALGLWLAIVSLSPFAAPVQAADAEPELVVRVGLSPDYAPYTMLDASGSPTGYACDLLQAVAKRVHLVLERKVGVWVELRDDVENGRLDLLPIMARSAIRAKKLDFSDTHIFASDAIFIRKDNTDISSERDLKNRTIAVQTGDLAIDYLANNGFQGQLLKTITAPEALRLVSAGKGDAAVVAQVMGLMTVARDNLGNMRLAAEPHFGNYEREYAFAVRKDFPELLNRLNRGLKEVVASGEYTAIYDKWFSQLDPDFSHRQEGRNRLLFGLLFSILIALFSAILVFVFRQEVTRKTRSLAESEMRFRSLVKNLPGVVYRIQKNPEWRYEFVSDAIEALAGYTPSEVAKFSQADLVAMIHPDDFQHVRQHFGPILIKAGRFEFDFRLVTKGGAHRWIHTRGSSTADENGDVNFMDGIYLDMTEQRYVSELLTAQQSKMASSARLSALGEMAGGIAHEINNPLAIINLRTHQLTQLACKGPVRAEDALTIASGIETTSIRISKIIKSLQTVARESADDPFERVPVSAVVADAFELCFERMRKHGIEVVVSEISDDLVIECKGVQLSQVLINLLNNAFDAVVNERERVVRLDARETRDSGRDCIEISIEDSGKGIPTELAQRIFQPFFTTKGVGKGTGLGLSISKGMIEMHDGQIWLDTRSPRTRFVILLPKVQPDSPSKLPRTRISQLTPFERSGKV